MCYQILTACDELSWGEPEYKHVERLQSIYYYGTSVTCALLYNHIHVLHNKNTTRCIMCSSWAYAISVVISVNKPTNQILAVCRKLGCGEPERAPHIDNTNLREICVVRPSPARRYIHCNAACDILFPRLREETSVLSGNTCVMIALSAKESA